MMFDEMPPGCDDVVELAQELCARLGTAGGVIVSIDGWTASGKSTLAGTLADRLGWPRLALDEYLIRNRGGFIEHLDYARLKADLTDALRTSRPVLVEGIQALEVLERLEQRPGLRLYVRRVASDGVWHDGFDLESSAEEVIERERQGLRKMLEAKGKVFDDHAEPLEFEVIRYHYQHRPHETADLYFNRVERPA